VPILYVLRRANKQPLQPTQKLGCQQNPGADGFKGRRIKVAGRAELGKKHFPLH
jgi:hypothetical protein